MLGAWRGYSERTAQAIDDEVRKVLADAQERVRQTLVARRAALDALATTLLRDEVVERAALVKIMAVQESAAPVHAESTHSSDRTERHTAAA
jgi:cell division protease FtsH